MPRDIIRTLDAPPPPPTYSQAVRAAGLVFVSGTGPQDPVSGKIVGETIQEQTRQCLKNVSAILEAAGTRSGSSGFRRTRRRGRAQSCLFESLACECLLRPLPRPDPSIARVGLRAGSLAPCPNASRKSTLQWLNQRMTLEHSCVFCVDIDTPRTAPSNVALQSRVLAAFQRN